MTMAAASEGSRAATGPTSPVASDAAAIDQKRSGGEQDEGCERAAQAEPGGSKDHGCEGEGSELRDIRLPGQKGADHDEASRRDPAPVAVRAGDG